ncbi:MAG: response regulator [Mediterranea massiliensis]|nr:response regulator [Mediterranea massiliensis]
MIIRRCVLLSFIWLLCNCFYGLQAQTYKYIGVENGLSNRRVFSIQKGNKGYMWFLTQDGIDRYDGKHFKHYLLKNKGQEENSLWNLNWLYTDSKGVLWEIGKRGRVFYYDSLQDEFKLAYSLPKTNHGTTRSYITYGFIDNEDYIWLCTKEGIYRYNSQNGESQFLTCDIKESITKIEQIDSTHYFAGTDKGIHYLERKENRLLLTDCEGLNPPQLHVNDIYYHEASKKVFIGTFQEGIFIYDLVLHRLTDLKDELKDITINCIRYFNEREILIGTDGIGVYKMNTDTYHSDPYIVADYTQFNAMNGNNISDIYIDNEQRIWMANYPFGITVRDDRYPQYMWIKHSVKNKQSLVNNQINAIIEDLEGDLWFATNNGVSHYCPHKEEWQTFLSSFNPEIQNKNHTFLSLCEIRPGEILVGGYNSGLYQINKWNGKISYHTPASFTTNELRPDKYIRTLLKDKSGKVWSGGYYNLKEIDLKNRVLRHIPGLNGITVIKEKDDDYLWIGTANGLYLLEKESGQYTNIHLPIESNYVYCLFQLPNGMLYIGTNNSGLLQYDPEKKKFEHYHKDNTALLSNNIYHILHDGGDRLVLSMENGLCNFNIPEGKFVNWTKEHGLMSDHFNASSGTLRKNGNFIFGSTDGAIEYHKDMRLPHTNTFRMVFNNLRIFNKIVYPGDADSPLTNEIDKTSLLRLKYSQNMFSIDVSSINFDHPSLILYSWKLEGFFDEWSEPSLECDIRFTNLSPGDYTLKVKAISSEDKRITLEEREIKITIEQPFWFSFWALLLYAVLLMVGVAIFLRFDMLRKKRKLSEEKINFFVNTAHDLRTPLTLIKAPLEEMEQQEPLSERGRESIYTALRNVNALLRLTTNLITFERADNYNNQLMIAEYELNSYMQELIQAFQGYAATKQLELTYQSNFQSLNVWLDRDKMESILKNLLSNALKYTPQNGKVEVKTTETDKYWSIEIKDTGIGIPVNEQKQLFKTHFRSSNAINSKITGSGIGLLLVDKLVRLHNGKLTFHSKEGEGTCITITFPINAEGFPKAIFTESKPQAEHITDSHTTRPSNIPQIYKETSSMPTTSVDKKKKLLIVEDNDELRNYLKRSLENYIVQTCANGKEAVEIIYEYMPDLIVADIMMPEMRGDELCEKLKNDISTSHIPIILLTALGSEEDIIKGLTYGADEYITKPFNINILRATIAGILANRERVYQKYNSIEFLDENEEKIENTNCTNNLDWKFITTLKQEVEKHMDDPDFNIDKLCVLLAMSRTSFYNKLRALTGQSPADYIRIIRLKHAAQLLKEQKYSITEIAEMTGFNDAKYFREVFKKHFKVSPSQYLKRN